MDREELKAELQRLIDANRETNPPAASVLLTLLGALRGEQDTELVKVTQQFSRDALNRIQGIKARRN